MTFPVPPAKGQPVRAELIRQIIDCLRMFRPLPGPNIRTRTTPGGTLIEGTPGGSGEGAAGTPPWTVRYHAPDGGDGQWEIWLPPGCMSVGRTLQPINRPASESTGHENDKAGWYLVCLDEDEGSPTVNRTDGEGDAAVTVTAREWKIVAHAKTSAYLDGVDGLDKPSKRYLWVGAHKKLTSQEQQQQTAEDRAKGYWGDEFSQDVATVEVGTRTKTQGESSTYRKATAYASAPISVQGREPAGFDLAWDFQIANDGELSVARIFCLRNVVAAAGISLEGPQMTELTGVSSSIWARIGTNPLDPSGAGAVEVLADPINVRADDYVTWIRLYNMTGYAVAADLRAASLANVQIYR